MFDRFWQWLGLERRAVDYPDPSLQYLYGDRRTSSGEAVSPERAIALSAVWSAVNLISGSIASMPLVLYRREGDSRVRYREHPLHDCLALRPNPLMSAMAFWTQQITSVLLHGNAFAALTRDDDGRVRALWPIAPGRVHVDVTKTGRLKYKVSNPDGSQTSVADEAMLHIAGPMADDGLVGRSVVTTFRETLGLSLALERHGSSFFGNALTPSGLLIHPGSMTPANVDQLRTSLTQDHVGPGKRHKFIILQNGMQWTPISMNHEDVEFLASRRFGIEEVGRIFGVPTHMLGGQASGTSMTYSNSETRALDFLKFCLLPWMERVSSAVNFRCIPSLERGRAYVEHLPDALLAMDTPTRFNAYKVALESGFMEIAEVRARENLPALVERTPTLE